MLAWLVLALILLGKAFYVQVIKHEYYVSLADKQYVSKVPINFDRGNIYFSRYKGTPVPVAQLRTTYRITIDPSQITNAENLYNQLQQIIPLQKESFMAKATKVNDPYEEIIHKASSDKAISIGELSLKGIGISRENWRVYSGDSLASHVLGIIGESKLGFMEGKYGIEKSFDGVLHRKQSGSGKNTFAELMTDLKDSVFGGVNSGTEGDVVTSIEPAVQSYLEKVLKQKSNEWRPDEIGGIIIDPSTGEIIAMAALPDFNPNDLSGLKDLKVLSNPLVERVYEMGSIVKPLTVAIGLDSGTIDKKFTYNDTGTLTLSGKKISNFDGKARGVTPLQQVLSQSLNVGSATIALKVGKDIFTKYMTNFGLGSRSGIDLPNEATGLVNNFKTGRDVEIATAAYGQGIAISPISMVRALAILANGGKLITPHVVKEIDYKNGNTHSTYDPQLAKSVISPDTAEAVTSMLVTVVDTALKQGTIKRQHYSVAAKTGTAQIPDHVNGGYYSDRYLHSFFGYFPAYNPNFLIFLYQIYPKGAQYASETLTEPFDGLTKYLIDYYSIPPDR
jgi:cell division protein FtsI/penicillin-binding protein 2